MLLQFGLRDDDLFILQAGSARACALHDRYLRYFFSDEDPPPLGMGPLADVRLYHTRVTVGDVLLLASPALMERGDEETLVRVLSRVEMEGVLAGLEQVGGEADLTALIVRWVAPPASQEALEAPSATPPLERERLQPKPVTLPKRVPRRLGERVLRLLGKGFSLSGHWLATCALGLTKGAATLFRRMLPGHERERPRPVRPRRPVPKENPALMMSLALGIPVVLVIVVALAYLWFGTETRFQSLLERAQEEVALAQSMNGFSEKARPHWEAALRYATAAARLRPDDAVVTGLQAQAQAALNFLDGVVRLNPIPL